MKFTINARKRLLIILVALAAATAIAAASVYTYAKLAIVKATVYRAKLLIDQLEFNYGQVPAGDIDAMIQKAVMYYPGKLGLNYTFGVSQIPDNTIIVGFLPLIINKSNRIVWAGIIVYAPGKWATALENYYWSELLQKVPEYLQKMHHACVNATYDEYTGTLYLTVNVTCLGLNLKPSILEFQIPSSLQWIKNCTVVDPSNLCKVIPAVNFTYPFWLPGGVKYTIFGFNHIVTDYVSGNVTVDITIYIYGSPTISTSTPSTSWW